MDSFFTTIPQTLVRIFTGKNLFWQLLAIVLTATIVLSGLDWQYFLTVRSEALNQFFRPALSYGFVLPFLMPLVLVLFGLMRKDKIASLYGWALAQAALLGWCISSVYKAFTGRVQPNVLDLVHDSSRNFQFGFLEHGIFWGWPSSHTTVAFAMSFALITLLPKQWWAVRLPLFAYALFVGIGVSLRIHWFSEFVAGAIIGTVIGIAVGTVWKRKQHTYYL